MTQNRVNGLDIFRGWAILLMVAYHFSYDLNHFNYIYFDLNHDIFWVYFRYMIVSMFLLSVGMSLKLAHTPNIKWDKMKKRTFVLAISSLLITIVTYMQFPHSWVYFGIIHFILLASWVGLLFLPYPRLSLLIAIFIFLASLFDIINVHWLFDLLKIPLHLPTHYTEDLVRFFPWFGVVLIGIFMANYNLHYNKISFSFFKTDIKLNKFLKFIGRHALIIYLVHQPVLFGVMTLLQ
jgi:uncharacterized membrane protein